MNILEHTIKGVSKTLFICLGSVLILLILLIVIPSCNHDGDGGGDISPLERCCQTRMAEMGMMHSILERQIHLI